MTELSLFTMHYISWLWHNSRGIRWNTAVRIVTGIGQVVLGLLHGGDILLLDEISSSLDEPTERELYHRLFAVNPQKTILLITHRSVVGKLCDKVVKL
jgi:ABC-type Na+ transport system ATPase subunit NatA